MQNWENLIVPETATLKEVMALFERYGVQIALVTTHDKALLGVIKDGDMRRSLLKNIGLTDSIKGTMNKTPVTVTPNISSQEVIQKFYALDIKYLPIVDERKIVKGLYAKSDFIQSQKNDTPVVIMAGGEGLRLRPLTENIPKPLVAINGTPIIETLLIKLIDQGFSNFFLSINYLGKLIENYFGDGKKWGISIKYIKEEKRLGTGGALGFLKEINNNLIVLNGDLITNVNFNMMLENHITEQASITVGVKKILFKVPYGVVNCEDISITSLEEKPILYYNTNCGIYVISPQILKQISEGEMLDMPCLINRLSKEKEKIIAFPIYEEWHDIGNIRDLEKIQGEHTAQ